MNVRDSVKSHRAKYNNEPSYMLVVQWLTHEWEMLYGSGEKDDSDMEVDRPDMNINTASYPSGSGGNNKRPRDDDQSGQARNKRQKPLKRPHVQCNNKYCMRAGHTTEECFSYGGPKVGQYIGWWNGPWNLHLHPDLRTAANNVRPTVRLNGDTGNTTASKSLANRITSGGPNDADVHQTLSSRISSDSRAYYGNEDVNQYAANQLDVVGGLVVGDEIPGEFTDSGTPEAVKCNASILDATRPISEACIHDSGANKHVFHSRRSFKMYTEIEPVKVNGFGKDLNTCAVGVGSVLVEAWKEGGLKVLYELTNCIHVPSARYNLISQAQLDNAGVSATAGNGKITIHKDGLILLSGHLGTNMMYKLNMWPVPQEVDNERELQALFNAFSMETVDDFIGQQKPAKEPPFWACRR